MNTRKRYYMRNKENQKRWAKLDFNWYPCGAYYDDDKERYIRTYRGQRSKYFKNVCNKKFRRSCNGYIPKGNKYRRFSEFWWEID